MMNEKQMTTNQSLYSTKRINFKKKIVSTVIIKSLMKKKINKKNERIHASSDFERSSKSKNRVQKISERSSTSKNIVNKYNNWKYFFREN